jgi:ATP-dependent helicase HrpA
MIVDRILIRTVQEAFSLTDETQGPRCRADFERVLAAGLPRLGEVFDAVSAVTSAAGAELDLLVQSMDLAAREPSGKVALAEIREQVEQLFPEDLLLRERLSRVAHYPRYLRAARTRLTRAIFDPRKDAEKRAPFAPLWDTFLNKRGQVKDAEAFAELRWDFEELRVALFDPDARPAYSVSCKMLAQALARLR